MSLKSSRVRSCAALLLALFLLVSANEALAAWQLGLVARKAGLWVLNTIGGYAAGKVIDYALGEDFRQQLDAEIPRLVERLALATGKERALTQQQLAIVRGQLSLVERTLKRDSRRLSELEAEQRGLLRQIDELEERVSRLESRTDELDARVSQLEQALISECLDLQTARQVGAEGFRVGETPASALSDHEEDEVVKVSLRVLLNSCTPDLTQRGLLIQVSLVTFGLSQDLRLYATFKHLGVGHLGGATSNHLLRLEFPLERPRYRVDGQVAEFFLPYAEIPFPSSSPKVALALVLTHDGGPIYALSDRVLSCVFGQRRQCRWGN